MTAKTGQEQSVRAVFASKSEQWGQSYLRDVREISELDLVLRRRVALSYLARVQAQAAAPRLSILDVGCASGEVLSGLDPAAWRVFGVDLVEEMVRQARRFGTTAGLAVADAVNLPFADGGLDVVTSLGVLEYIPQWTEAVKGIVRVLKPGGALVVSFPNRQSVFRRLGRLEGRVVHSLRWVCGRPGNNASVMRQEWSRAEVMHALTACGLEVLDSSYLTFGLKGRVGDRSRWNLKLARRMPASRPGTDPIARRLAWTMVLLCTKPPRPRFP